MTTNSGEPQRPTERNPRTAARFRRESFWQITFPMIVISILMLGCLAGLLLVSGKPGVSIVADYSMILLSFPVLLLGLVAFALFAGLIYIVGLGIDKLPPYAYIAHKSFFAIQHKVERAAGAITGAIITIRAFFSGIGRFLREHGLIHEEQPSSQPGSPGSEPGTNQTH